MLIFDLKEKLLRGRGEVISKKLELGMHKKHLK